MGDGEDGPGPTATLGAESGFCLGSVPGQALHLPAPMPSLQRREVIAGHCFSQALGHVCFPEVGTLILVGPLATHLND